MADKQKLFFTFNSRNYSYRGKPENRLRDLVDFIAKLNVSQNRWLEIYRVNIPGDGRSNAEIMQQLLAGQQARQLRRQKRDYMAREEAISAALHAASGSSPTPPQPSSQQKVPTINLTSVSPNEECASVDENSLMPHSPTLYMTPRNADQTIMTPRFTTMSRHELDQFVTDVLNEQSSIADKIRSQMYAQQDASDTIVKVLLTTLSGDVSKLITLPINTSYEDLVDQVKRKFGGVEMRMVFKFDTDEVDLDDNDSLHTFLELRFSTEKLRLVCIPIVVEQQTTGMGMSTRKRGAGLHEEIRTFTGHTNAVYSCAFSPSGKRFVTASRDKTVRVWNAETGESRKMQGGHEGYVLSCDFSPNDQHVVSASDDHTLRLWSVHSGEKLLTFKGHAHKVYATEFNPTGAFITSASCDHSVRVWNAETGARQALLKGHQLAVFTCGFSKHDDGKLIVSGSDDRQVKLWDWRTGKAIRTLHGHTGTVWSCAFSHDGKYIVSASMDHELRLWDVASGQVVSSFMGHLSPVHHAIFTPDDRYLISAARDWTCMAWNVKTGEHVDTISGHLNTVYHMDVHDDTLLTCSLDETVKLWELKLPRC